MDYEYMHNECDTEILYIYPVNEYENNVFFHL